MKIGLAQINPIAGDFAGNAAKIAAAYQALTNNGANGTDGADLVLAPELALTGAPAGDLILRSRFLALAEEAASELGKAVGSVPLVFGSIAPVAGEAATPNSAPFLNAARIFVEGREVATVGKRTLISADVQDERRYFTAPREEATSLRLGGGTVAIALGADLTDDALLAHYAAQGATVLLHLTASLFVDGEREARLHTLAETARRHSLAIAQCNLVGGNGSYVFDGASAVVNARGELCGLLESLCEQTAVVDTAGPVISPTLPEPLAELHDAIVLGLRDYMSRNGFKTVILGLSGGIDSAVVAALAVAALGKENVFGVAMPTEFSTEGSVADALALARNLGISCPVKSIQAPLESFRDMVADLFAGLPENEAEENMQPRLRGMLLMALSNKFNHLVLCTGNKSELAVGYCTLYGDMAGGFALISDLYKTEVYALARYINRNGEVIPSSTLEKAPSAELRHGQVDQDTLPAYELLDEILTLFVDEGLTGHDMIARGYDAETVRWVVRRVDANEYKRVQAAPGLKVSRRAFGPGRRIPLVHRFVD